MTRYHRRRPPDRRETLTAAALAAGVAVGVGAATFYLARLFIARETLGERAPTDEDAVRNGDEPRDP